MKKIKVIFLIIISFFDWRCYEVFKRNFKVYMSNWKTAFLPPTLEPVIFLIAFGMGLGTFIGSMVYEGNNVEYIDYVVPGILAFTAFMHSFFEVLYGSFIRMYYQKTWDGMLGTQLELRHIISGEIIWGGFRCLMSSSVISLVFLIFHNLGFIDFFWQRIFLLLPFTFIAGIIFGSLAMVFTSLVPSIDHMNFPVFLIGMPLGFFSNTYFPVGVQNPNLIKYLNFNPLYHLSEFNRGVLLSGEWLFYLQRFLITGGIIFFVCILISQHLMKKRLIGD